MNRCACGSRLESFLLPSPMTSGRCPNSGTTCRDAQLDQRPVQRDLPRRARQQVLAAQHVGDLHQRVVDRVDQRVERVAVGAAEREVGDVLRLEGDLAAHQVVPGDRAVGHPEPHHRLAPLGLERRDLVVGELAAEAVVPLHLGAGRLAARVDLLGGAVAVVGELRLGELATGRRGRGRPARSGGTARAGRPCPAPRPSRGRATASRRASRRRTPRCSAPCRCPRCGRRRCRRGAARTPSCRARSARSRRAASRSATGRSGRGRRSGAHLGFIAWPPGWPASRAPRWPPRPRRRPASGRRPPAYR